MRMINLENKMPTVNAYITFNGNCEAAFDFYKSVFGGEYRDFNRYGDLPESENPEEQIPSDYKNKIMHISLPISNETILYGGDAHFLEAKIPFGFNIALSINTESREEAQRIFQKLSENGSITMPIADTFWGAYFGMLTDQFKINWMVNFDPA